MTIGENGEGGGDSEDGVTVSTALRSSNIILNLKASCIAIVDLTKNKPR